MPEAERDGQALFDVRGRVAVITGGSGELGRAMALGLARAGVQVAILGRHVETADAAAEVIRAEGGSAMGVACDVLDRAAIERAASRSRARLGRWMFWSMRRAAMRRRRPRGEQSFFDLDPAACRRSSRPTLPEPSRRARSLGAAWPTVAQGSIVNIASMAALRPLTRIPAYSAAKAAVVNFTQWLAVILAQEYGPRLRVNALAPGFFLTEQNRYLLTDAESGAPTPRGADHSGAHADGPPGRAG